MNHLESALIHIDRMQPFPVLAARVLELIQRDASQRELVAAIEQDPGLTVQVLRLANSALYGSQVEIDSLASASALLGLRKVANLALTQGCSAIYAEAEAGEGRDAETLWKESLHNALHARRLATRDGRLDPELAYTVGLLQNIGHVVLERFMAQEWQAIGEQYAQGKDLLAAERSVLGIDHAQCGALMVRRWGLPRLIIRGIQFHHSASKADGEELLCAICGLAEDLAGRGVALRERSMAYPADGGGCDVQEPGPDELEQIEGEIRVELELAVA